MNLLGAGGAVFCPAGAGEDARAADFAAAEFFGTENGLFQLWLLGQHGAAKPPAKQAAGDVLQASAVQQQAVASKKLQQRFVRPRTLRSCPGVKRKNVPSGSRSMGSSLCIFTLLCDELCI